MTTVPKCLIEVAFPFSSCASKGIREVPSLWCRTGATPRIPCCLPYDCATPRPRLVRVRDPFAKLVMKERESLTFTITAGAVMQAAEEGPGP